MPKAHEPLRTGADLNLMPPGSAVNDPAPCNSFPCDVRMRQGEQFMLPGGRGRSAPWKQRGFLAENPIRGAGGGVDCNVGGQEWVEGLSLDKYFKISPPR
jgi:hypothetical protein